MTGGGDKDKTAGEGSGGGIDHNSPYYLHPSDVPKQLHVNEVLSDSNFSDWSQEMENFLFAKNKIDFVDGTLQRPEKGKSDYMPWMRCDAMVKGWLTTAMEKGIRDSVKYATTAAEIWTDLRERFGKESSPRAFELKQKIIATRQGGSFVSVYYTTLRTLWDETSSILPFPKCSCRSCTCDVGKKLSEYQEKERLYQFLMGLDAEFYVIKTQILATKPIPPLSTVYHLVAEDERQRTISNDRTAPAEPTAFKTFQNRGTNFNLAKEKNVSKAIKDKKDEYCTHCNKNGHKRDGCFKLVGYPDWWPGKKNDKPKNMAAHIDESPIPELTKEQYQMFINHFKNSSIDEEPSRSANMAGKDDWIVDSGCTEHITSTPNLLTNKSTTHFEPPVIIPNGDAIPVEGKGDCTISGRVKINGVLCVPAFKCNLLLVSRVTKDLQCAVTFFPDFCVMQKLYTRTLIGSGRRRGGLY